MYPMSPALSDHPSSSSGPRGWARLDALVAQLRALGKNASPKALKVLRALHAGLDRSMEEIVRRAPQEVIHVIGEVLSTSAHAAAVQDPAAVMRLQWDVRSPQEGADRLEKMIRSAASDPRWRTWVGKTLDYLEAQGVLGQETLSLVVAVLGAAAVASPELRAKVLPQGLSVVVGPLTLGVDRLGAYTESLKVHAPWWTKQALEVNARQLPDAWQTRLAVTTPLGSGRSAPVVEGHAQLSSEDLAHPEAGGSITAGPVRASVSHATTSSTTTVRAGATLRPGGGPVLVRPEVSAVVRPTGSTASVAVPITAKGELPRGGAWDVGLRPSVSVGPGRPTTKVEQTATVSAPLGPQGRARVSLDETASLQQTQGAPEARIQAQATLRFGGIEPDPPASSGALVLAGTFLFVFALVAHRA